MPTADVTVFNVDATEPDPVDTFAQLLGAQAKAESSAVSAQQTSNPASVNITGAEALAQATAAAAPPGTRALRFDGTIDQDRVLDRDEFVDGYYVRTYSGSTFVEVAFGGAGSGSGLDARVFSSETPPDNGNGSANGPVTPRRGNFALKVELDKNKNYSSINGGPDKPRA